MVEVRAAAAERAGWVAAGWVAAASEAAAVTAAVGRAAETEAEGLEAANLTSSGALGLFCFSSSSLDGGDGEGKAEGVGRGRWWRWRRDGRLWRGGEGCGGGERQGGAAAESVAAVACATTAARVAAPRCGGPARPVSSPRRLQTNPRHTRDVSDCSVCRMRVGRGASPGLTLVHIAGQAVRQAALMQCRGSAIAGLSRRAALRPRAPACTGRATWDARPAARGGGGRRAGGGGGRGAAADQRAWIARTSSGAARRCRVLPSPLRDRDRGCSQKADNRDQSRVEIKKLKNLRP